MTSSEATTASPSSVSFCLGERGRRREGGRGQGERKGEGERERERERDESTRIHFSQ